MTDGLGSLSSSLSVSLKQGFNPAGSSRAAPSCARVWKRGSDWGEEDSARSAKPPQRPMAVIQPVRPPTGSMTFTLKVAAVTWEAFIYLPWPGANRYRPSRDTKGHILRPCSLTGTCPWTRRRTGRARSEPPHLLFIICLLLFSADVSIFSEGRKTLSRSCRMEIKSGASGSLCSRVCELFPWRWATFHSALRQVYVGERGQRSRWPHNTLTMSRPDCRTIYQKKDEGVSKRSKVMIWCRHV